MSFYGKTDTELLELLIKMHEKLGKWPSFDDVRNIAEILPDDAPDGLPNNIYAVKFGTLDKAISKAQLHALKMRESETQSEEDGAVYIKKTGKSTVQAEQTTKTEMSESELKGSEKLLNELKSESEKNDLKAEAKPKEWKSLGEIPFTFMNAKVETFKGNGVKGSRGMIKITYDDDFVFEQKVVKGENVITLIC
ncbi:MAG: hypothetical protein Q4E47_03765 [Candidatus Saccharibacteria bacterium]|nr:hypothetical protein [Candidatus Saccharibacteria bacterium]